MSPEEKAFHAFVKKAIDTPWLVTRGELREGLEKSPFPISSKDEANIWGLRHASEASAVSEGKWPSEIPVPPNTERW